MSEQAAGAGGRRRRKKARPESWIEFHGVSRRRRGKFGAQIRESTGGVHRQRWLGTFDTVEDAARAYDTAAVELHGATAVTNFKQPAATGDGCVSPLQAGSLHMHPSVAQAWGSKGKIALSLGVGGFDLTPAEWEQAEELLKDMESTNACKADVGRKCPPGTTTLDISQSKGVSIKRVTLLDSKNVHMSIYDSTDVTVQSVRIVAPADSPKTDGIHVQLSSRVSILRATIGTGDDCVSMGPDTSDVLIRNIKCGPDHGISIGSLGGEAGEEGVRNVTAETAALTGTQNGMRIKTWGKPNR